MRACHVIHVASAQRVVAAILRRASMLSLVEQSSRQEQRAALAIRRVLRKSQLQIFLSLAPMSPCCRCCNALTNISPLAADRNGNAASGLSGLVSVAVGAALHASCGARMSTVRHRTQSSNPAMWRWSWLSHDCPVVACSCIGSFRHDTMDLTSRSFAKTSTASKDFLDSEA